MKQKKQALQIIDSALPLFVSAYRRGYTKNHFVLTGDELKAIRDAAPICTESSLDAINNFPRRFIAELAKTNEATRPDKESSSLPELISIDEKNLRI